MPGGPHGPAWRAGAPPPRTTGRSSPPGAVRLWLQGVGATTLFITPGSPWENGYVESFNGKLRDELLDRESSIPSGRCRSSPSSGAVSTTTNAPTAPWAIALLLQRPSSPPLLQALSVSHDLWYNYWGQVNPPIWICMSQFPARLDFQDGGFTYAGLCYVF